MVHFVGFMCRFHENMHLNHFEKQFGIGIGWPKKEDYHVVGDVDLDVL